MSRPTFLEGVAVALGTSVVGTALFSVLTTMFDGGGVLRLLIAGISLGYVLYLLSRSRARVGRITAVGLWAIVAALSWYSSPPLLLYLLVHMGLVWLIRSLYFYSSVLSALGDLGLTGLSLAAGIWAVTQTGSLFLSIWCFFLVQALFVGIPTRVKGTTGQIHPEQDHEDRFERAHSAAQAALRKFSSVH